MKKSLLLTVAAAVLSASAATAQFCTVGPTPPVVFTINGAVPSSAPATHTVGMPAGDITLSINDGMGGRPFILLSGVLTPSGFPIPVGCGALDLSTPFALLDGIFGSAGPFDSFARTNFSVTATVAAPCSGYVSPGFQVVYFDPALSPLPYGFTEAGACAQAAGATTNYNAIGDDVFVTHNLVCPVNFGGVNYTRAFIGSNGMITFNVGSGDFTPTNAEFFAGFRIAGSVGANPGVAPFWGDYARGTVVNDNIMVVDGPSGLFVEYQNQIHWDSMLPAGNFSANFDNATGSVTIDNTLTLAGGGLDAARIVGITDGADTVGLNTVLDISANQGAYVTAPNESVMESFPTGGAGLDLGITTFFYLGGLFDFAIL